MIYVSAQERPAVRLVGGRFSNQASALTGESVDHRAGKGQTRMAWHEECDLLFDARAAGGLKLTTTVNPAGTGLAFEPLPCPHQNPGDSFTVDALDS